MVLVVSHFINTYEYIMLKTYASKEFQNYIIKQRIFQVFLVVQKQKSPFIFKFHLILTSILKEFQFQVKLNQN